MSTVPKPPSELDHPAWCARVDCAEEREHRSAPLQANVEPVEEIRWYAIPRDETPVPPATAEEMLVVKARLTQLIGTPHAFTYVAITGYDDPGAAWHEGLSMTPAQARLLIDALTELLADVAIGEAVQP